MKEQAPARGCPRARKDMFIPHRFLIAEQETGIQNLGVRDLDRIPRGGRPTNAHEIHPAINTIRCGEKLLLAEDRQMLSRLICGYQGVFRRLAVFVLRFAVRAAEEPTKQQIENKVWKILW
jgi:hypothetical protein